MLPWGLSGEKGVPETKPQMTLIHLRLISHSDEGLNSPVPVQAVIADATGAWLGLLAGLIHQSGGGCEGMWKFAGTFR